MINYIKRTYPYIKKEEKSFDPIELEYFTFYKKEPFNSGDGYFIFEGGIGYVINEFEVFALNSNSRMSITVPTSPVYAAYAGYWNRTIWGPQQFSNGKYAYTTNGSGADNTMIWFGGRFCFKTPANTIIERMILWKGGGWSDTVNQKNWANHKTRTAQFKIYKCLTSKPQSKHFTSAYLVDNDIELICSFNNVGGSLIYGTNYIHKITANFTTHEVTSARVT